MRAPGAITADPVANDAAGMLQSFEPVPMSALLLGGAYHALDHAILLRAVRRDEFLLQALTANQSGVAAAGED